MYCQVWQGAWFALDVENWSEEGAIKRVCLLLLLRRTQELSCYVRAKPVFHSVWEVASLSLSACSIDLTPLVLGRPSGGTPTFWSGWALWNGVPCASPVSAAWKLCVVSSFYLVGSHMPSGCWYISLPCCPTWAGSLPNRKSYFLLVPYFWACLPPFTIPSLTALCLINITTKPFRVTKLCYVLQCSCVNWIKVKTLSSSWAESVLRK